MSKKTFVGALAAFFLATTPHSQAQQPIENPRIGFLSGSGTFSQSPQTGT
jgi:hypothetical protein